MRTFACVGILCVFGGIFFAGPPLAEELLCFFYEGLEFRPAGIFIYCRLDQIQDCAEAGRPCVRTVAQDQGEESRPGCKPEIDRRRRFFFLFRVKRHGERTERAGRRIRFLPAQFYEKPLLRRLTFFQLLTVLCRFFCAGLRLCSLRRNLCLGLRLVLRLVLCLVLCLVLRLVLCRLCIVRFLAVARRVKA